MADAAGGSRANSGPEDSAGTGGAESNAMVVGPTAALRGRAGGPGFIIRPQSVGDGDGARSSWQMADGVWRGSGIRWEERPAGHAEQAYAFGTARAFAAHAFLSAPTMADAPPYADESSTRVTTERAAVPDGAGPETVARGPAPRAPSARRRNPVWNLVTVGAPAAVIVTVGAGAFMMLTGQSGGMLNMLNVGAGPQAHGAVSAGQPAVSGVPGTAKLTSVAAGRSGWIAAGESAAGHPVVLTSPDGVTWHEAAGSSAFNRPGLAVSAVAAGAEGYVVAGHQVRGMRRFATMWWSPDLRDWVRAGNGNLDGRLGPSTVYGVTATVAGFTAVGAHSGHAVIWTTRTGRSWTPRDLMLPGGAASAELRFASASGGTVVAAGEVHARRDAFPFAVVSRDGGREWLQALLPASGGGTVSALTASGTGFVAAGLAGPAGDRHPVTWTSPDGVTWSAASR